MLPICIMDWSSIVDAPIYSSCLDNQCVDGKVVSVYDGDTVKILIPLGGTIYKWNCRLSGVDTPEVRTRNKAEKKMGYMVRDKLREKISDKVVKVTCGQLDKYGRLLVEIKFEEENVNQWLIDSGYAFAYDGGKKTSWAEYLAQSEEV